MAYRILISPWVTEKSYALMGQNKYVFKVAKGATKGEVKKAVEGVYGVKVLAVSVINTHAKGKMYGRHFTQRPGIRKATVTLKEGDRIEFFAQ